MGAERQNAYLPLRLIFLDGEETMKQLPSVIIACGLLGSLAATARAASPTCPLTIHVDGFRNQKGHLGVTIFTSPDGWPEHNDKAFLHDAFPIDGNHATAKLELPQGRYAIAVLHDENSNHKLDRNFVGIPKEGFGFSNNPAVHLSAPSFDAAATQITCPATELLVHLIYK